jgi:hypothetical protein
MIMTWVDAVNFLIAKGMKPVAESPFSDQDRVYFAYGANDAFFDHSATVTNVGKGEYHVSDFSHIRNQ